MKNGFEDWEFWVAITKLGWTYKVVEEFLFFYRKQKQSMLIDTLQNHRVSNMKYVFKKHKDVYLKHHDSTMDYLLYLLKQNEETASMLKKSTSYKLAKFLAKPLNLFKK